MTGGDFIVEGLPIWCDSYVIHDSRKLFVDSFLSGMGGHVIHSNRKLYANSFLSGVTAM